MNWIVKKYLPYNFFEDEETQNYFHYLNPTAHFPKRNELKSLITNRFVTMQGAVKRIVQENKSKISFTIDSWSSVAGRSYHVITIHFIDDNWKIQSLLIDFCATNGEHTGRDIALVFYHVAVNYGLNHKIEGITVDNASANTSFMRELSHLMDFDPENQHFQCYAHILNLAAQDLLKELKLEDANMEELGDEYGEDCECFEDDNDKEMDKENHDTENEDLSCNSTLSKLRTLLLKLKKSKQ